MEGGPFSLGYIEMAKYILNMMEKQIIFEQKTMANFVLAGVIVKIFNFRQRLYLHNRMKFENFSQGHSTGEKLSQSQLLQLQ